ncbi:hypothetical protein N7495_005645 [Penicillium taxi]|uniref:uncharacterized protein n=1 Tax=Penicillium taxi TaxID=168475 RepID=UPI002544E510|nr:uncharacterized protein N7495_005645 [Penicillium taxi]KAJ5893954.1 hypothetical protein N7495_005645 [Penicillium taxi]
MEEKFMEQQKNPSQLSLSGVNGLPRASTSSKLSETSSISSKKGLPKSIAMNVTSEPVSPQPSTPNGSNGIDHGPESEIFKNEIDIFVHSGANFCFGILNLLISMVPPAFTKLLSIIGFRGDKERGLQMLWQASKFHNLIGALAALALLGYYNGFVRYCDIMPDQSPDGDNSEGYPQERLADLLAEMRSRFPHSRLWLLEESRMKGANRDLKGALDLLTNSSKSPLKQVEALCVFEKSLNAMFLHEYNVCSESFVEVSGFCQIL